MSEIKLTTAQSQFVQSEHKNTLVSASAGSGKTSTMIAKLTDMICNKNISINRLLVVTYTNSAGNEMKQKLFTSLSKMLQDETDEGKIEFISDQLDDMVNCDIGTLHSICKKIITSYFYIVEQDPGFSLIDGQQADYLYDCALDNVFNNLIVQNNEEFYSIYQLYNKKRDVSVLKYMVKTLHTYLLSKVDGDEWRKYVIEKCCSSNNNISKNYLFEYYKSLFNSFIKDFEIIKVECEKYFEKYLPYINDKLNYLYSIKGTKNYEDLLQYVDYKLSYKPRVVASSLSAEQMDLIDKMDIILKEFSDLIISFKKNFVSMNQEDFFEYGKIISKLFDLVEMVKSEYDKIKKNQNLMDFSDLEHVTLKILEEKSVVDALKQKYDYIFVDEYQDINQVQEEIISRLKKEDNLYMIGDVKQSIYAFRLSSPEIFINKYNQFEKDGKLNQVINLNENFRSNENILSFTNEIFNKIIVRDTIGIDYEKSSQLVYGKKEEFKQCVSLNLIDEDADVNESELIAYKIGEFIKEGYNYRDIAILLRSKGDLVNETFSELKKYNIPCEATYKTDLFNNPEVLVIYYLLKLVNNSMNDVAMGSILKSVFVGLNDNELAEIRLINSELSFSECVYEYMNKGTNEHIRYSLKNLCELLKSINDEMHNNTIVQAINNVLNKYNIFNYYLSFVDGMEKISNIKELLRIISNEEYKFDLQRCIEYLDMIKKEGEVSLTLSGSNNCVKITTIHSSKGLEYPVVILGGISKKFVLNKQTDDIIINDRLGIGVKIFDKTSRVVRESLIKTACKIANKKSEIDEEIRLLYVALTRAKNKLCIIGKYDIKDAYRTHSKSIYSSKSYLDLMVKAFPKNMLQFFTNKQDEFILFKGKSSETVVSFIKDSIISQELVSKEIKLDDFDPDLQLRIGKFLDYNYPYINAKNIAIKNSVSQILKEEIDYENSVDSIVSLAPIDDYSLRLGTAYHNIMQNINYTEDLGDILQLIDKIKTADLPYNDVDPIKVFLAVKELKSKMSSNSKIMKEAQFVMRTNYGEIKGVDDNIEVLVQGVIDLAIINDNEAIIVDFKTNKTHNEQYLIDQYGLQLKMYAMAFEKAYDVKVVNRLLYSFELGKFIEIK